MDQRFVPVCPICASPGRRDLDGLALDCTCGTCGWHYSSPWRRSVLRALSRPALALLLLACSASSAPPGAAADHAPRVLHFADVPADAAAGDPGSASILGLAGAAGAADAGADVIAPDAGAVELPAPDAGPPPPPPPILNDCDGLGDLACSAPPCKLGAECAIVRSCDPAYPNDLCVDCPGADLRCQEALCGGAWRWTCASGSALRCTNGKSVCL
jgi:hypothetical protein